MGKLHDGCLHTDTPIDVALMQAARGWVAAQDVDDVRDQLAHYSTSANEFLWAAERAWSTAAAEIAQA